MTHVAEIVTFRLAEGVSDAQFVELSRKTEAFVRASAGFVHRQLSKGEDGTWTDYVVWRDMDSAQAMAAAFPQQDCAGALMAAIVPDSLMMRHQHIHWDMAA